MAAIDKNMHLADYYFHILDSRSKQANDWLE